MARFVPGSGTVLMGQIVTSGAIGGSKGLGEGLGMHLPLVQFLPFHAVSGKIFVTHTSWVGAFPSGKSWIHQWGHTSKRPGTSALYCGRYTIVNICQMFTMRRCTNFSAQQQTFKRLVFSGTDLEFNCTIEKITLDCRFYRIQLEKLVQKAIKCRKKCDNCVADQMGKRVSEGLRSLQRRSLGPPLICVFWRNYKSGSTTSLHGDREKKFRARSITLCKQSCFWQGWGKWRTINSKKLCKWQSWCLL